MFRSNSSTRLLTACGLAIFISSSAHAAISTADAVVQYDAGSSVPSSYWLEPYSDYYATAPLGLPDPAINLAENDNEGIYGDNTYVTPFNAQYNPAYITAIGGTGGYIELHMSQPISTSGYTLGVHTGSGLEDSSYPDGVNSSSAETYTNIRSATVLVSEDGNTWISLGSVDFNNPTNIYTDISGPDATSAGTQEANFGQPFLGNLSDFDGQDFTGTLSVLNGSAGGTWLNLSSTGLSQVDYVAFETDDSQTMYIDSVVGVAVPEPTALGLLVLPLILRRRR
ncbi:MAG TPA: hypothetical protein VGG19_03590 [Tepidisphaeraceae bacterium]